MEAQYQSQSNNKIQSLKKKLESYGFNENFNEEKDFWLKIKSILHTIKANKEICTYIETVVFKFFLLCLI